MDLSPKSREGEGFLLLLTFWDWASLDFTSQQKEWGRAMMKVACSSKEWMAKKGSWTLAGHWGSPVFRRSDAGLWKETRPSVGTRGLRRCPCHSSPLHLLSHWTSQCLPPGECGLKFNPKQVVLINGGNMMQKLLVMAISIKWIRK